MEPDRGMVPKPSPYTIPTRGQRQFCYLYLYRELAKVLLVLGHGLLHRAADRKMEGDGRLFQETEFFSDVLELLAEAF